MYFPHFQHLVGCLTESNSDDGPIRDHPETPHRKKVRYFMAVFMLSGTLQKPSDLEVAKLTLLQRLQTKEESFGGQNGADMMLQICSADLRHHFVHYLKFGQVTCFLLV